MAFSHLSIGFHNAHLLVALARSLCENQLTRAKMPYVSTSHEEISRQLNSFAKSADSLCVILDQSLDYSAKFNKICIKLQFSFIFKPVTTNVQGETG